MSGAPPFLDSGGLASTDPVLSKESADTLANNRFNGASNDFSTKGIQLHAFLATTTRLMFASASDHIDPVFNHTNLLTSLLCLIGLASQPYESFQHPGPGNMSKGALTCSCSAPSWKVVGWYHHQSKSCKEVEEA